MKQLVAAIMLLFYACSLDAQKLVVEEFKADPMDLIPSQADIFIDNQRVASGSWKGRRSQGLHQVEARLDRYYPQNLASY